MALSETVKASLRDAQEDLKNAMQREQRSHLYVNISQTC